MSRENSPFIVGEYWLDKRRDGRSPEVWQIASSNPKTRSWNYRSTGCRSLSDAKEALKLLHAQENFNSEITEEDAQVTILILQYTNEHASEAISASSLEANMRLFLAFLMRDKLGIDCTISQLNPLVFERYRVRRMNPHEYEILWQGKLYRKVSPGVVGETVSKNLDDVRAALNYAVKMGRIKVAPRVPALNSQFRSPPRDRVLSYEELGAILGYASFDPPMFRWIILMLATGMRPEAALKLNPDNQYRAGVGLLDLHPKGAPRTKKRNPVVSIIPELHEWLVRSEGNFVSRGAYGIASMKRRWRTMRRELGLGPDVVGKTIRHTVATQLRANGASIDDIAALLGHRESNRITAVYAKYSPDHMEAVKTRLSIIWDRAMLAGDSWRSKHVRNTGTNAKCVVHDRVLAVHGDPAPLRDLCQLIS